MEAASRFFIAFCFLILPIFTQGQTCTSPSVKSKIYTTTEATSSTETVFIAQFNVDCKNGAKNLNLYADFNGKSLAVTKAEDGSPFQYQVSYSDDHKNLPAGSYEVKFYDEEGYSNLKKAQRSGESTDSISSLFSINISHPGVWKGPLVQSEFVAATVAVLVWYFAYTARNKLQSS